MNTPEKLENNLNQKPGRALLISFCAGCLTVVVAGLAIAAGVLLDLRNDTLPRWTLIFLLGSVPLTLGGVYLLARRVLKRGKKDAGEVAGMGDEAQNHD